MPIGFIYPWALLLLPLALVPLWRNSQSASRYSSLAMMPDDRTSQFLTLLQRLSGVLVFLTLVTAIASPFVREHTIERIGKGAQIVLLIDRSASMNANFAGSYFGGDGNESKSNIARNLLAEFINRRPNDLIAMVLFNTSPIFALPLTNDRQAIQAAIKTIGAGGKGVTNIAPALLMALDFFRDKPVTGARVVLLVSDGAAVIEPIVQKTLERLFDENHTRLYWIYLRTQNGARLSEKPRNVNERTTPEYFLHRFFQNFRSGYLAFEAENPGAIKSAIAQIDRLENKQMRYDESTPRQDLTAYCYACTLFFLLVLATFKVVEAKI